METDDPEEKWEELHKIVLKMTKKLRVVISKRVEIITDGEILLLEDIHTHKKYSVTSTKEVKDLHKMLCLMEKLIKLRNEAENWMQETENSKTNLELVQKELEQLKESKRNLEKELQITKQKLDEYQNHYQKEPLQDSRRSLPPLPPLPQSQNEILRPTTLTQISIQDYNQVPLQTQEELRKSSKKKKPDANKSSKKNAQRKSLVTSLHEMELKYSQLSLYEEKDDVNDQPKQWDAMDYDHREPKFKVYSQRVKSTYLKKQKQQIFNHTDQPQLQFTNNTPIKILTNNSTPGKSTASVSTVTSTPTTPTITKHTITESEKKKQRYVKSLHLQTKIMDAQNGKKKYQKQKLKSHPKNSENDSLSE